LLEEVLADLLRLQAEADVLGGARADGRYRIGQSRNAALRSTLAEGCAAVGRRLDALGCTSSAGPQTSGLRRPPFESPAGGEATLKAYRPCFDRLGRALREARRVADVPTMAVLSRLIVSLEKHLWLFDLPIQERRAEDWSAVNLFALC